MGLAGAVLSVCAWWSRPVVDAQSRAPVDESVRQFRVIFGLKDTAEREWVGRVTVSGGAELAGLRGWHFSGEDRAAADGQFRFKTKIGAYEDQLRGQTQWNDPAIRRLIPQGLILRVRGAESGRVSIGLGEATPPVGFSVSGPTYVTPLELLDGNVRVERLPVETLISESGMQDDWPALTVAHDGTAWAAWLAYQEQGDWVVVGDGNVSARITDKGDHHSPTIAALPNGWVLAAWSQRDGQEFHVYTSFRVAGRWSAGRRMTTLAGSHIWPQLSTDGEGRTVLVWQSLREGRSAIRMRIFDGRNWSVEEPVNQDAGNAWAPAALAVQRRALFAWDSYASGAYQVWFREWPNAPERVTVGESFSVRPSLAVSPLDGKIVVAWEESDALWGKDYSYLADRRGTSLYKNRRVRLAVRDSGGMWRALTGDPGESLPAGVRRFVQQPRILFDSAGRLHLLFRCRTFAGTARVDNWAAGGRWETYLTRREGDRWTTAVLMPESEGRNSMRAAMAIDRDRIVVAWPTDRRAFPQVRYGDLDIYNTRLAAVGAPSTLSTEPLRGQEVTAADRPNPDENADVQRMRGYRVSLSGKEYRIVRGDLHRHTELSQDGSGDGQLDDLYRYALDAAQMDYAHVADHQMGVDEEYNWWITQKSADLYFMPQRLVTLFGYERSVPYPNGHRNVIWAERGRPVLRIGAGENKGTENTGPILYPYLERTNGIATSHSSATEQGTDWRDHNSSLEPMAEIYQGFDSSYENPSAPRAWKDGDTMVHQGIRRDGYLWMAWAKGFKLGVQASSDHVSTHVSFACVLVEDFSRQGLLDAMRRRHTYAATDAIVLDYRLVTDEGTALMGDIVASRTAPRLEVKILGTAPIAQVDVVKSNKYVYQLKPGTKEAGFSYVDSDFGSGESYYYVRAQQADGQLVWSSPIWVRKRD
jgi:hypothetical protein